MELSVCGGREGSQLGTRRGGGRKRKTENAGGHGAQGSQTRPRRRPEGACFCGNVCDMYYLDVVYMASKEHEV